MSTDDTPPLPSPPGGAPATDRGVHAHEHAGLSRAVQAVFSVTLLSRFGGLARDVVVARVFGDSVVNSAFQSAFTIPNMFRRLFGEGALSAAFIPEYASAVKADGLAAPPTPSPTPGPGAADRLASLTLAWLGLATGLLTAGLELALLLLLAVLPANPDRTLSLQLIMVTLPFMPLICIVAIQAAMLQVHGRFAASSTGPLILNGFIIAVGVYAILTGRAMDARIAFGIAAATTLSGLTQAVWFLRLLRPHVRWTRDFGAARPAAGVMLRRFVPVMLGLGTLQLNAFLDQVIAMWPIWVGDSILGVPYPLDGKSAGLIAAAQRLYQFPLGVFGIAVATAVFPMLARHAAEPDRFCATLRRGLRLSLLLGLPASLGIMFVRDDVCYVLYAGGGGVGGGGVAGPSQTGFSADGLARTAAVLLGYAPAIWAYSLNHVLTRAFYARGDTMTPMRVSMALVGVNLLCNVALIWPLREAGLAWSSCITAALQCGVLLWLLRRIAGASGPTLDGPTVRGAARILAATILMGLACWAFMAWAPQPQRWFGHLIRMLGVCAVGLTAFTLAALVLRVQELWWLARRGA